MKLRVIIVILNLVVLIACKNNQSGLDSMKTKVDSEQFKLKGSWIYHDESKFELIDINDTNDVIYYFYINNKKEIGEKDLKFKHSFYKSKAKLGYWDTNNIWIKTDKYRFDYILRNDSMIEYDKMGEQKAFIKLISENN